MLVARLGPALRTGLGVSRVEYGGEIEIVAALECARFLESAMSTLFHGPAPTCLEFGGKVYRRRHRQTRLTASLASRPWMLRGGKPPSSTRSTPGRSRPAGAGPPGTCPASSGALTT